MLWVNLLYHDLVPILKYTSSFIFLSCLTFYLIYMIQKIRWLDLILRVLDNISIWLLRRSLSNKDSPFVFCFTLFGCFMVVYVILLGGGYMTGLWLQGHKQKRKTEQIIRFQQRTPVLMNRAPAPSASSETLITSLSTHCSFSRTFSSSHLTSISSCFGIGTETSGTFKFVNQSINSNIS